MLGMRSVLWGMAWAAVLTAASLAAFAQDDRGIGGSAAAAVPAAPGVEKRVALVIGNAKYEHAGELKNPLNDADDIAAALREQGFAVALVKDCTKKRMDDALADFGKALSADGVALFFYAGHGGQHDNQTYLIPVDARLAVEGDMPYECVHAGQVLTKMEAAGTRVNIVILDACRNSPFARNWRSSGQKGLAALAAPNGSIISYAADAGQVADENPLERNGLYTKHLLENIRKPDLELRDVFMETRAAVARATNNKQVPAAYDKLLRRYYLARRSDAPAPLPVAPPPPAAPALVGHLQVAVNTPEATVTVDGKAVGKATLEKALNVSNLPAGKSSVRVEAEGYEPLERVVEIPENEWKTEKFVLAKAYTIQPEEKRPPTVITPETRAPKSGEVRVFEGGEFAWIPPGDFEMGAKISAERVISTYGGKDEWKKNHEDEHPQHHVKITRGFWLATKEVTNREFEAFVTAEGYRTDAEKEGWAYTYDLDKGQWGKTDGASWRKPGWRNDPVLPVVCVSWNDAMAYCRWLSAKTGESYGLPTEAQWEYACRAGTSTEFFWGDRAADGQGYLNGADETKLPNGNRWDYRFPFSDGYWAVAPVGNYKANPWGLHDMLGNVWEWCADWYGPYSAQAQTDPTGPASGEGRVLRGASWGDAPGFCRAANRVSRTPANRYGLLGFRLLRTP